MRSLLKRLYLVTALVSCAVILLHAASVAAPIPPPSPAKSTERFAIVPDESEVVYRVGETIFTENNRFTIAIGVTKVIRGEIFVDRATPSNSRVETISIDISQFTSDKQRRDMAIRNRWLESARFPIAEFTPTTIQGLPQTYADGRQVSVQITGDLKIREVVKSTTFATTLKLEGNILTGVATSTLHMTDFGFDPPSIIGILRAENEVRLEFRFTARRVQS